MQCGVLCDPDHGEDLLKMGREPEGLDLLALLACGAHHLNDERYAAGIEVLDLGKAEKDAFCASLIRGRVQRA